MRPVIQTDSALLGVLRHLASTPLTELDLSDLLFGVCADCTNFDGVSATAILPIVRPDRRTVSSPEAGEFVALQQRVGADPFTAPPAQDTLIVDFATAEQEWTAAATALGFCTAATVAIRHRENLLGWLIALFDQPGEPPRETMDALHNVAAALAATMRNVELHHEVTVLSVQLSEALHSRVPIEQAKGMLAERTGVNVSQAFGVLRAYARRNQISLQRAAHALLSGAQLDAAGMAAAQRWTDWPSKAPEDSDTNAVSAPVRQLTRGAHSRNKHQSIAKIRHRA